MFCKIATWNFQMELLFPFNAKHGNITEELAANIAKIYYMKLKTNSNSNKCAEVYTNLYIF